jgi:hypothetical protein
MLKQTVQYEDFDGNPAVDTLYFNLSKTDLANNMHLQAEFEDLLQRLQGPQRELKTAEVQEILNLVKKVMKLSYGIRSEDGKRFKKSEEIWEDFQSSAVYDAYLYGLFVDSQKANEFLMGVLPPDLRKQAVEERERVQQLADAPSGSGAHLPPAEELSDEELLKKDPSTMTNDELRRAFALKAQS